MIRIVQHLCPQRHCIMALAYDAPGGEADPKAIEALKDLERLGGVNPWCGLCGSRDLHFEDGRTRWQTMEEARPAMAQAELENAASALAIKHLQKKAGDN